MASYLPVISSNFPGWETIVETAQCGICVDPLDVSSIVRELKWFIQNPLQIITMGRLGREAIKDNYSWEAEVKRLTGVYQQELVEKKS